jgi:hypothetical protein
MPKEGENIMKFRNFNHEFMHPFHVVADFESTLKRIDNEEDSTLEASVKRCLQNALGIAKGKYQEHIQNSYGLKYNCIHEQYSEPIEIINSSNPDEVNKKFIESLEHLAKKSYKLTQQNKSCKSIKMTDEDTEKHCKASKCSKCLCAFSSENKKVKHHDHITGNFIDTLCSDCNLKYQYKRFLPVYIHNLKGYDSHLFVKSLYQYGYKPEEKGSNISCIPNNEERYISFSKLIKVDEYEKDGIVKPVMFEIRFLDTFSFMGTSIDKLSKNLALECKNIEDKRAVFKNISKQFPNDEQFELMTKKGIYPYDYIDDYSRLYEKRLPSKDAFYSELNNSSCSDEDYEQAKLVWLKFNCQNMLDYHNLYLVTDVLLLADIWENFRRVCYNNYSLDCEYYYTAPSLSFDAMLKYTKIDGKKIELELLTDLVMYEFVEKGIRGGISQISHRHALANNKYMADYDKSKEDSYIVYLDANALYSGAMCEYLPYKDFKWNHDKWDTDSIVKLGDKDSKGYLFEVDLHIPEKLHNYMNNYPPCPENISIEKDDLNQWQQENYKKSNIKKLCLTFKDKKEYVVNYRYLKLVLSLGVELKKVHRVLEYTQKDFLKDYIMLNNDLRKASTNEFEKDFRKLMNNSIFGKFLENVRNRINFRLINTEDQALRVKNMKRFTIFNDDLVGVHQNKKEVKLCKPIYIGQNILDDSKCTMYNFHYNFMLKKIERENIDLLFTDTDSLCYYIRKEDIFEIIKKNKDLFDLSKYPKDHEMYDDTNNKALFKFKIECPSQIIEFVGLRPKLYSYMDEETHNKCKGMKEYVSKTLRIDDYRNTLYNRKSLVKNQNTIRSYGHQLFTESNNKIALSYNDDKVYILDDNVSTRNIGHFMNKK